MGEDGASVKAHGKTALEIGGEEQGEFAVSLKLVGEGGGIERTALEEEAAIHGRGDAEGSEVVALHGVAELEVVRAIDVEELDPCPDHDELADFVFDGHLAEGAVCPVDSGGIIGGGSGGDLIDGGSGVGRPGWDDGEENEENQQ